MKKVLLLLAFWGASLSQMLAADSDWYLYIWSDTNNSGGDVGQFQTTSQDGICLLEGVTTTENCLKYCIHNSAWSISYGWSTGSEGSVSYTGTEVALGTTSGATGWLGLDAGTYDVTFNVNTPSVQFDMPVPTVGNGTKKVSILGDSYSTYYGYLRPYTNKSWYSTYTTQYYSDNDVTAVSQTWWYKFITGGDYVLERNNSYSGATMVNGCLADMDVSTSFISRATDLGSPDIIFVFGGTNDWWNGNSFDLGDYVYSDWTTAQKAQFRPGFTYLLNLLQTTYADADIYFILNDLIDDAGNGSGTSTNVRTSITTICEYYNIPLIELTSIDKGSYHPTEAGMTAIATQVQAFIDNENNQNDEGNYWYLSGTFNSWGNTHQFMQSASDSNVFTLYNFVPSASDLDEWSGFTMNIVTPQWAQNYVCNSTITTLGTPYGFVLKTDGDSNWNNAYCTAMTTGNAYNLSWNKQTHELTITESSGSVTDGNITYTLYPDGHALAAVTDDYLRGGDISMLNYVESMGAKFYDANGMEKDALDIMQENGVNTVRLRLYNNPGQEVSYTPEGSSQQTFKIPVGYLDEEDILSLARRAKAHNMKIELTFHYSDFWTNGQIQLKPKAWEDYNLNQLKQAVYDYTFAFLQRMNAQGTAPDYVSLGNEIQGGLLFGYYTSSKNQINTVNGYCDNMSNVAALLGQGCAAVRAACPEAKVVIHLAMDEGAEQSTFTWFFDAMKTNNLDYDIIGASYYPYYTNEKPTMLTSFANKMYSTYGKDVLIMETGYSWTQYLPNGRTGSNYEGQLHMNNTVYNEASEAGQKSFMQALQAVVKSNDHILGYLYWDPVMVDQKVNNSWIETSWALKKSGNTWYSDGNVVSNTTWFDYEGKALDIFEAIAEDAVSVPATITVGGTTYTVETAEPYTLSVSDVGYATFYDSWARTLPDGLTAYTVQGVANSKLSTLNSQLTVVPAETGVLLQGNEGTYYLWPRYDDNSTVTGNMLYGTTTEQTITAPVGSYYYYKLANNETKGLGWYWGEANGGTFLNGAHKAYLAVPQSQANARSFIPLFGGESTAIGKMINDDTITTQWYDLQGRRMARPAKGLYIVNGKKRIIN